ncbi:MAG: hypothetical protein ABW200_03260, partial [Hyphomicrobiaceae bacterium]
RAASRASRSAGTHLRRLDVRMRRGVWRRPTAVVRLPGDAGHSPDDVADVGGSHPDALGRVLTGGARRRRHGVHGRPLPGGMVCATARRTREAIEDSVGSAVGTPPERARPAGADARGSGV